MPDVVFHFHLDKAMLTRDRDLGTRLHKMFFPFTFLEIYTTTDQRTFDLSALTFFTKMSLQAFDSLRLCWTYWTAFNLCFTEIVPLES